MNEWDKAFFNWYVLIGKASMGQPLFIFHMSPSFHPAPNNLTYYQLRPKWHNSQSYTPSLHLKRPFLPKPQLRFLNSTTLLYFHALFTLRLLGANKGEQFQILLQRLQKSEWDWKCFLVLKFLLLALVWGICLLKLEIKFCSSQLVVNYVQYSILVTVNCKSLFIFNIDF